LSLCGHSCKTRHKCSQNCPDFDIKCLRKCIHTECNKKCQELCIPSRELCDYSCLHSKCTNFATGNLAMKDAQKDKNVIINVRACVENHVLLAYFVTKTGNVQYI